MGWAALQKTDWRQIWKSKRVVMGWRIPLVEHSPAWARRLFGPAASRLDMLLVDHGIFRLFYLNKHRLGDRAWRLAQPAPRDVKALARQGVRTILNLRGERQCGSYWLETAECVRHGIKLVDFQLRSRSAPKREEIRRAAELFEEVEYPLAMHCKSGADRAGMMSVLYLHLKERVPLAEAKRQLGPGYGHFRRSNTGVLDAFFERYLEDTRSRPMTFLEWVDRIYDPDELQRTFRASGRLRRGAVSAAISERAAPARY
jgi:protein tyrosine/serine phosphatase